jgi:hypothetical protein
MLDLVIKMAILETIVGTLVEAGGPEIHAKVMVACEEFKKRAAEAFGVDSGSNSGGDTNTHPGDAGQNTDAGQRTGGSTPESLDAGGNLV